MANAQLITARKKAPADPTELAIDPTELPIDPTMFPVDPAVFAIDPTMFPVDPTMFPIDPTELAIGSAMRARRVIRRNHCLILRKWPPEVVTTRASWSYIVPP